MVGALIRVAFVAVILLWLLWFVVYLITNDRKYAAWEKQRNAEGWRLVEFTSEEREDIA